MEKNTPQPSSETDLNVSSTTDFAQPGQILNAPRTDSSIGYKVEVREYEAHSGPLPSPEVLKAYDEIVPGAAERILRMAEKQLDHNIIYEKSTLESIDNSGKRGQWFGFILTILLIGAGIWVSLLGLTAVACIIFGTAIAAVVGAYVTNILKSRKDKL